MISPYSAYRTFLAVRSHFRDERYDYFKYNGKVRASEASAKKHQFALVALVREHPTEDDMLAFFVSNLFADENFWISDFKGETPKERKKEYQKYLSTMRYTYRVELEKIDMPIDEVFGVDGIVRMAEEGEIRWETVCLLNNQIPFFEAYSKKLGDPIIWPKRRFKLERLAPFLGTPPWASEETLKFCKKNHTK